MYYLELPKLEIDKDWLNQIYENDKHKMKKWSYKGVEEDYYEIVYKKDSFHLFDIPNLYEPHNCQFVIIPPKTRIGIHKDVNIQSRIGVKLRGDSSIKFYSERKDEAFATECFYQHPSLINVTQFHDVVNDSDEWRVTWFITFNESFDLCKAGLRSFH
jgi:hypothetical protein